MVTQFISTLSVLDLCDETERTLGVWVEMRWWYQAGIDLAGAREMTAVAAEADENGM